MFTRRFQPNQESLRALGLIGMLGILFTGCSYRLHEPPPPSINATSTMLAYCETLSNEGSDLPSFFTARDAQGNNIALHGTQQDGFFQVEAIATSSEHHAKSNAQLLHQFCQQNLARPEVAPTVKFLRVRAGLKNDENRFSIVYPRQSEETATQVRIVVFGDSLSDEGLLKRREKLFPSSPYWNGRFSNGPVWSEYLDSRTGVAVQNHAYGGASLTGLERLPGEHFFQHVREGGQFFISGSIGAQVSDYREEFLGGRTIQDSENTVAIIWAGANDYISKEPLSGVITTFLNNPEGEAGYRPVVQDGIDSLENYIAQLNEAGVHKILLLNLPDLGRTPIVMQNETYIPLAGISNDPLRRMELSTRLSELSRFHNSLLDELAENLRTSMPGSEVHVADSHSYFQELAYPDSQHRWWLYETIDTPDTQLGIAQHCYNGSYLGSLNPHTVCDDPSITVFWDVVHPTTQVHCLLSNMIVQRMTELGWLEPGLQQAELDCAYY